MSSVPRDSRYVESPDTPHARLPKDPEALSSAIPRRPKLTRSAPSPHLSQIVCFPCNQFGWQEPGSQAEIKKFVEDKFDFKGVGVNMMSKIDVNGGKTHPVWQFLKEKHPGDVRWNFAAKFIIDSEGNVVERNGDSAGASKAKIEALLKPLVPA